MVSHRKTDNAKLAINGATNLSELSVKGFPDVLQVMPCAWVEVPMPHIVFYLILSKDHKSLKARGD